MNVDDDRLMAYLDDELDAEARAEVEAALAEQPALRAQLDRQRALRETLRAHFDPVAEEAVPPRLRALIEPEIVDLAAARARRSRPVWQTAAAIAASLVIGIFVGRTLPSGAGVPVGVEGGTLVAQGSLAEALDTQLASAQPADAATRIGVSFAREDGTHCRTFESSALSGLACRDGGAWRMVMTAEGSAARGDYRQAGTSAARIAETAQDLMAGEPLDASSERQARDAGWRPRR
jgi:hypothetical protein